MGTGADSRLPSSRRRRGTGPPARTRPRRGASSPPRPPTRRAAAPTICAASRCAAPARRRAARTPPTSTSSSSGSPTAARPSTTSTGARCAPSPPSSAAAATRRPRLARKLSTLRGLCRDLTERGVLGADPTRQLPGPRRRRRLPRVLSLGDVDALLEAAGGTEPLALRDRLVLELLYGCGLRSQELVDLTIDDVRAGEAQLIVHGKGGKTRIVPMGEEAAAALRRYLEPGPGRRGRAPAAAGRSDAPPGVSASSRCSSRGPAAALLTSDVRRAFAKILPACRHRGRVAAHAATRLCHTHAGEGCRSSCHPGAAGACVRVDHAGLHARQRRASAARLRPPPPAG